MFCKIDSRRSLETAIGSKVKSNKQGLVPMYVSGRRSMCSSWVFFWYTSSTAFLAYGGKEADVDQDIKRMPNLRHRRQNPRGKKRRVGR